MEPVRYLSAKRAMCAVMFMAMPLVAYGGGPPFKSTLVPCDTWCGAFGTLTEAFIPPGESSLVEGLAGVSATGVLKVQVKNATANEFYSVWVGDVFAGPFTLPNILSTDASGDGSVNNNLPTGTYISGVFLMRDTDANGMQEPRIATGFAIP